jgi:hypothetical protein
VRPLDEASLTIWETPPHRTPSDAVPARGHGRRMTNGTFTNTYLVGRKTVPFVTAPAEQNHSDRQRTGDQHMRKGTYSVYGAFRPLLFGPAIPPTFSKDSLQNELPARPLRLPSLETSHPPRQDAQINYLDILTIFVKQRTYLAILLLFGHLAPNLVTLPNRSPAAEKFETKRNLFCATPRCSPHTLVRLLRFLRTFLQAIQPPRCGTRDAGRNNPQTDGERTI